MSAVKYIDNSLHLGVQFISMMLDNKKAVVTGANRGIGLVITKTFLEQGAEVIACMRNLDLEVFKREIPTAHQDQLRAVELNLENEVSIKSAIREIASLSGHRIDILINNAGTASGGLFQLMGILELRRVLEINLIGQLLLTQGLTRLMTKHRSGSIINIASTASEIPDPGTLAYGVSKAGLVRASLSMATELGISNIRVNTISPGLTKTDMYDQMSPAARENLIAKSILKRAADPQDIANVALFLASDLSSFVTGQTLRVDGGII